MLLQHDGAHAGPTEQVAEHHAGGPTADDAHLRLQRSAA
jgi:hypothetical protein